MTSILSKLKGTSPNKKLPRHIIDTMIDLKLSGDSYAKIGRRFGISRQRVGRIIKTNVSKDVDLKHKPPLHGKRDEIREVYKVIGSTSRTAKLYGVSAPAIYKYVKDLIPESRKKHFKKKVEISDNNETTEESKKSEEFENSGDSENTIDL